MLVLFFNIIIIFTMNYTSIEQLLSFTNTLNVSEIIIVIALFFIALVLSGKLGSSKCNFMGGTILLRFRDASSRFMSNTITHNQDQNQNDTNSTSSSRSETKA